MLANISFSAKAAEYNITTTELQALYSATLNNLRLVAMASVVWGHTLSGWESQHFTDSNAILGRQYSCNSAA